MSIIISFLAISSFFWLAYIAIVYLPKTILFRSIVFVAFVAATMFFIDQFFNN